MFTVKNKVIYISTVILLLLYSLSFLKVINSTDKREEIKSALVNPKYKNDIYKLELTQGADTIYLQKSSDIWILSEENSPYSITADSKRIENLLNNLTKVTSMCKLSDNINKNSSFGLLDDNSFKIKYFYTDGFHTITFGNQDFSLSSRFLMTDKSAVVYEINDSFDSFLTTNIQNWSEPYLISRQVFGKITEADIQKAAFTENNTVCLIDNLPKLLELRHGGIPEKEKVIPQKPEGMINIELGNKAHILLEIYDGTIENEHLVKTHYSKGSDTLIFYSKISTWTYNKIKEITL